ncbi:MAG: right-handed parallel beta-helix repeat-containing protein [Thermoplasmata archaeon]
MPKSPRALLFAAVALMLVPPLLPASEGGAGSGRATPPPSPGDWLVNDTTILTGEDIVLKGNLTVGPSGSLTLTCCTLTLDCSYPGEFGVSVLAGGELILRQSTLQSSNVSRGFLFTAHRGSLIEISRSTVRHAGVGKSADGSLSGLRVLTPYTTIHNTTFERCYQCLHVRDTTLRLTDCELRDSEEGVAAFNSTLIVSRCTFRDINSTAILASDRSALSVSFSNFTGNRKFGIYVSRSTLDARRNTFTGNYNAIWAEYSSSAVSENSTMLNNTYRGVGLMSCASTRVSDHVITGTQIYPIEVRSTRALLENITLSRGLLDIYLTDRAYVECVNCTVRPTNISVGDAHSRLNVSWFLGASVVWWSSDGPVQGAEVRAYNASGALAFQGVTDAQGRLSFGKALEYTYARDFRLYYGPYKVVASRGGRSGYAFSSPDRSLDVLIKLDDIGPVVRVEAPENGTHLPTREFELRGTAWDNETSVTLVEYRTGSGAWKSAKGTSFWNATLNLSDGTHTVQVRAWDATNNTGLASLTVTVDTKPPMLCVTAPASGNVTRNSETLMLGYTEAGASVTVNGAQVAVDNRSGAFNTTLRLTEGDNVFLVEARDRAGNRARVTVVVRLDTMILPFEVYPLNGTFTNQTNLTIFGAIEENTTLKVCTVDDETNLTWNELAINVTGRNFSLEYPLRNGTSHLRVSAWDRYGNNATADIYVTLDTSPPLINLSSPPSQLYYTRERRLVFAGVVERGASLTLNGKPVLVEEGNFSKPVTLDLGENVFVITASDAAGNTRVLVYRVVLDRERPFLNVTSPKNGARTTASKVLVKGFTEQCATVIVNGKPARVDASGAFKKEVALREGNNTIEIVAYDLAGNPSRVQRLVVRERQRPILSELEFGAVIALALVLVFVGVVAWDTKRTTGKWGLKRPTWLRVPDRLRALIPKPTFGREEYEAGAGAVQAAARREGAEPEKDRGAAEEALQAPLAGAKAAAGAGVGGGPGPAPPTKPAQPPQPTKLGEEYRISEKPVPEPFKPLPPPTEVPVPVPDTAPTGATPSPPPASGAPTAGASTAAGPAPSGAGGAGGAAPATATTGPSAPASPPSPSQPPGAPLQPPKPEPRPEELDPLAEILGTPTKKL